jgi:hypothetical protein
MEKAGRTLLKIVPVEVEVVVADSWAEKLHLPLIPRHLLLIYYQSILGLAGDYTKIDLIAILECGHYGLEGTFLRTVPKPREIGHGYEYSQSNLIFIISERIPSIPIASVKMTNTPQLQFFFEIT